MKRKLSALFITALFIASPAFAEYSYTDASDYTGDVFFTPPSKTEQVQDASKKHISGTHHTVPPLKQIRMSISRWSNERKANESQLAPTNPEEGIYKVQDETSDFASKELKEEFDENMSPDGFEADDESIEENKKQKRFFSKNKVKEEKTEAPEDTENIVLDCENMNYDTDNYCLYATGNVNVEFVKQQTVVKADKITYDRVNNTIKAEGNVKILKHGQTIAGDYIFVDLNEESALIENPVARNASVEIRSQKGYVYGDKIVQENGTINVDQSYPINFISAKRGPIMSMMMTPKDQSLTEDMEKGLVRVDAKYLQITQKGDLEVLRIKHASVKKGKHTLIKIPALRVYTNKNHDYLETNVWEVGSIRGLGLYTGPGVVFELPKGSVLKAMPILQYKSGIGFGGLARFNSGTNFTQAAYGTQEHKLLVRGRQELDDDLFLQYAVNDYMNEWFLGRRRPKYGVGLVYDKTYASYDFLLKNRLSQFSHRLDFGYYQEIDKDRHFREVSNHLIGTTRTRYMAEASQSFYDYRNPDTQNAFRFDIVSQLSAALYGTGDTQFIGRIGPRIHTQWKRWMQDVGYFQSVYSDSTPMPVYDAYRYGKSNLYMREYFRICRYLTFCWFSSFNLSNDAPNNKYLQENSFWLSIGPDDFKFNVGYDFIRENMYCTVEVMMNAKGTQVNYDKLVIKQDKKAEKDKNAEGQPQEETDFQNSEKAPVLQHAVVEDIKTVEDVL